MRFVILVLFLLFGYVVFSYIRFKYVLEHANLPEIIQREKILGTGKPLRYITAGDSTALGEGALTPEKTYAYKIASELANNNQVFYKNIAVVGATTDDVLSSQVNQIAEFKPDVVTISIGANDLTHLHSSQRILRNYKQIISELTGKTTAKIYITDVANFSWAYLLPWIYIRVLESKSKGLNPQIMALESERVKIVNIHDFGWSNYPNLRATLASDHFHPNDLGYENWTNAFLDKINKQN